MSRFRLGPTRAQEVLLTEHCRHARSVWNLAVEQHSWWTPRRGPAPGFAAQARQLTEAGAASPWLAAGSQMVQQQALRDFAQAMTDSFAGTHGRPTWRKAGVHQGFRIVAVQPRDVRRLSRRVGAVRVPENRESQATFACRRCGHRGHADVNAAVNIRHAAVDTGTAAGRAVVLRGEGTTRGAGPVSREPQRDLLLSG